MGEVAEFACFEQHFGVHIKPHLDNTPNIVATLNVEGDSLVGLGRYEDRGLLVADDEQSCLSFFNPDVTLFPRYREARCVDRGLTGVGI